MDEDPQRRLGAEIRRLRSLFGMTQEGLAIAVGWPNSRTIVCKAESGRGGLVPEKMLEAVDRYFGADGALLYLRNEALLLQRANRLGVGVDFTGRLDGTSYGVIEEAGTTDRRDFGGLSLAVILTAAGQASNDLATANPPPLTLEEMEAEAEEIAAAMLDGDHAVLLRRAAKGWHDAHVILTRPVSGEVRGRLLLLAGGLACKAAFLGLYLGNADVVRRFGTLAGQYAAESGDPLLVGKVACLRSTAAFERGQYAQAAETAARGRAAAHPSQRARLAAYEAEALGAAGREGAAREALAVMRAQSRSATSWTEGDTVIFEALTLAHLEDWSPAGELARLYIDGGDNDRQGVGLAHVTVGRCLLGRDSPDPAAAAHAGMQALEATPGPDMIVVRPAATLHTDLRRRWPTVAEVSRLGEALETSRAALAV